MGVSTWLAWDLVLFAAVLGIAGIGANGSAGIIPQCDVCLDDGAALQCSTGYGVHLHRVRCADGSRDCPPGVLDTLFRLCQGQGSCGRLGLRDMFSTYCRNPVSRTRSLLVSFTCEHTTSPAPACLANLCSNVTRGLSCPENSVLHVRNLTCGTGLDTCSPATFLTLYSLCEGRRECDASGLRMLTPITMYCGDSSVRPELSNVFVDFLCVPTTLVQNKCTGQYKSLAEPFGVLMNPGFTERVLDTGMQCNWFLSPENSGRIIHVLVHMAYSKWSAKNCTTQFLQVRYKSCVSGESSNTQFCDLSHVNALITSCGPVHVSSWLPAASDQTDRFLVSYQILPKGSSVTTPGGMAECYSPVLTTLPPRLSTRATVAGRNYGPGGTLFDYSDTIRQTGEDSKSSNHSDQGTFQFKLIILYVFFGVVILALVVALIYVLVSYRGISRSGHHEGDSSEKTALWRHDDTPLDTFNHNSHTSLSEAANVTSISCTPVPESVADEDPSESQVVACTVHAESSEEEKYRQSFTSFLSDNDPELHDLVATFNPYASVSDRTRGSSTLPGRGSGEFKGGGSNRASTRSSSFKMNGELSNIYESIDSHQFRSYSQGHSPEVNVEQTPLIQPPPSPPLPPPPPPIAEDYDVSGDPSRVDHYTVNNDQYALVRKPKSRINPSVQNGSPTGPSVHYTNLPCVLNEVRDIPDGIDPTYDSVDIFHDSSGPVVGFRPTSGPYDKDRNPKSEPVSPSSNGTSRHRWDEL